jgi:amidase
MMMAESMNHVFGITTNPRNRLLSAGGSSGGEAALIAMRGSPLGVGTDIGGSIRIPAAFNNLYSLRPSFGRFPTYGARSGMPGQEAVNSVNGPLANSVGGLKVYSKNIVDSKPWLRGINSFDQIRTESFTETEHQIRRCYQFPGVALLFRRNSYSA